MRCCRLPLPDAVTRLGDTSSASSIRQRISCGRFLYLRACPRCKDDLLENFPVDSERALCINCGWRALDVPEDVSEQVKAHKGMRHIEDGYKRDESGGQSA